jgi:DNA-binding Xre family transcriptional regulator
MTVRFRLREILEKAGIGQSELSRSSGVSFATINRMCTNATRQVSLDVLEDLCAALKIEPGDIIVRDRSSNPRSDRRRG